MFTREWHGTAAEAEANADKALRRAEIGIVIAVVMAIVAVVLGLLSLLV